MHHDERYQRLMQLLEREIAHMLEVHNARIRGHDELDLDLGRGVVVYLQRDKTLWQGRTELIGTFLSDVSIWRWWWYGSDRPVTRSALNAVYAAGQSHGVRMLTSAQPIVRDDREAVLLANVCAALAKADGVHLAHNGVRMTFYALFGMHDPSARARTDRPSSPTPASPPEGNSTVVHHDSLLPAHEPMPSVRTTHQPIMSMPPAAPVGQVPPVQPPTKRALGAGTLAAPAAEPMVKAPARELVMPLAKLALASVVTHMPSGFQQALITLDLQVQEGGKVRFFVVVVAADLEGNLVAVPTPQGLMEAARDLIAEDARRGNGRWHRLTARLKNKPTGISVLIEVIA